MSEKIIIDALYSDEVRLAVCKNNILEEYYYQNNNKKSIKNNIYLAKIEKIEPSLQAAFVNYCGEKHGFLPLSEIHHHYFKLNSKQAKELKALQEKYNITDCDISCENLTKNFIKDLDQDSKNNEESEENLEKNNENTDENSEENDKASDKNSNKHKRQKDRDEEEAHRINFEQYKDALHEFYNKLKIQEVLSEGQTILVQVRKEERGNKGASLTTYITLAGRYSVLMPQNSIEVAISKKISDPHERNRLYKIGTELINEAKSGSLIMRTACENKTKTEIKRDFVYLNTLWLSIKEYASSKTAPLFIHEEGDIIKKCIRDVYNSDIGNIIISGKDAYKNAEEFVKMILPRHIDKIVEYTDIMPIFSHYKIEEQISKLYDNVATLPSGGYLVINQTEALVAIDVNSGRATTESDIEGTAVKINIEAAREVIRQLKLRDLSGLIVIDFIDMIDEKNQKLVETELKRAANKDKARIQIGKISQFGLLEMSRQRMGSALLDMTFTKCETCDGRGKNRSFAATASTILRAIRHDVALMHKHEKGASCVDNGCVIEVSASGAVISYLLNEAAGKIDELSNKLKAKIAFIIDEKMGVDGFYLENKKVLNVKTSAPMSTIDDTPYIEKDHYTNDYKNKNYAKFKTKFRGGHSNKNYSNENRRYNGKFNNNNSNKVNNNANESENNIGNEFKTGNNQNNVDRNSNKEQYVSENQSGYNNNRREKSHHTYVHGKKSHYNNRNNTERDNRKGKNHKENFVNDTNERTEKSKKPTKEDKSLLKKIFDKLMD